MTSTVFILIGFLVMFGGVAAGVYGKISRRTARGLLTIGIVLMFIGIVLAAVVAALVWLAVITVVLVTGRYAVRSAKARHDRQTTGSGS